MLLQPQSQLGFAVDACWRYSCDQHKFVYFSGERTQRYCMIGVPPMLCHSEDYHGGPPAFLLQFNSSLEIALTTRHYHLQMRKQK